MRPNWAFRRRGCLLGIVVLFCLLHSHADVVEIRYLDKIRRLWRDEDLYSLDQIRQDLTSYLQYFIGFIVGSLKSRIHSGRRWSKAIRQIYILAQK